MVDQTTPDERSGEETTDVDALYEKFESGDTLTMDELQTLQDAGLLAETSRNTGPNRCFGCGQEGYKFSCPRCTEDDL